MNATPDSTLANPEQRIADLERQLAEREAELAEALRRETATGEVLQVINSSPGDLAPVFEAILEKALRLCEAALGSMVRFDGDAFHWVAARGVPEAWFAEFTTAAGYRPTPSLALYRFLNSGENIEHVADIAADDSGRSDIPDRRRFAELSGARTAIWVALRKDQTLLGAFVIYRREVRPFSQKQIALLKDFAAQAVIAMENARLLTETREALEQQTATAEILRVISNSPADLQPTFDAIAAAATTLTDAALSAVTTFDGRLLHMKALSGFTPEETGKLHDLWPLPADRGTATGRAILTRQVVHIEDLAADPERSYPALDRSSGRTVLVVPMLRDGVPIGAINVQRRDVQPFIKKQIDLITTFADQAVIAMENARLITETREALEQQTATAKVLQVINSSPGNLQPVFDAILEKAHSLCGAVHGVLVVREGETGRAVAARGLPEAFETLLRTEFPVVGNPVAEQLLSGAPFVQLADLSRVDHPLAQAATAAGLRPLVAVALRREGTLLGWIAAARTEVRLFSDKDVALLQNFAAQAVIAMENARLLGELRQRTDEVAELNRGLEARVAEQIDELGRVGRLKRFLAPQLAELIVSQGDENILESHRREIVVVFCDLRGYTAFTETAEPEEVLAFLREYHGALGPLVSQYEGTLDQFSGDGIMVFFNDPVPCPDPAERAVKMAMAMREEAGKLIAAWRRHGCELGFGAGIAQGYATLGQIGFSERSGYTAIGTVCNLAARLCAEAKDGQILVSSRIAGEVEAVVKLEDLGNLELKGLRRPVAAFNVVQSTSAADARPNLTVVARGPGA